MRLDKVDLNLFVVFNALYQEQSVTKVAQLLNLTQPAVSNALNRLRQTFDDPLFVRSPGGMSPTGVADSIIVDVRKALQLLGRSVATNAKFSPAASEKVFHLGMNDLAEALIFSSLQKHIYHQSPGITISSYYTDRQMATEELKSGKLDLLLDTPAVNAKEFEQVTLAQLPYVVAMRPNHPLSDKPLTLARYLSSKHIHVSSRRRGRGQMDVALNMAGHRRQITMRVKSYLVAARIAEQTDLIWTVPGVLADTTGLYVTEAPFAIEPLRWNLYWNKNATDDPANGWMRNVLTNIVDRVITSQ